MKRYRKPKLKTGELRIYYGKLPHDEPDIIYTWQGESSMKRDTSYLHYALGMKRQRFIYGDERKENGGSPITFDPSFIEELIARGYDITTMKFSILKKDTTK